MPAENLTRDNQPYHEKEPRNFANEFTLFHAFLFSLCLNDNLFENIVTMDLQSANTFQVHWTLHGSCVASRQRGQPQGWLEEMKGVF